MTHSLTHSHTHWLTDTQTDFIICPMLLTHWADNNDRLRRHSSHPLSPCGSRKDIAFAVLCIQSTQNVHKPENVAIPSALQLESPVVLRFNYDGHSKAEAVQPMSFLLKTSLRMIPYITWPWPFDPLTSNVCSVLDVRWSNTKANNLQRSYNDLSIENLGTCPITHCRVPGSKSLLACRDSQCTKV